MEEDSLFDKVEKVIGCHVEDAVTFWAQNINRHHDILKTSCALAEICPQARSVFGNPDLAKVYGGCFSEDKCWYRCKVQRVISDEKCQVLYIDYGNSEILNRSEIVEIPSDLQFPSVAEKYRLWGFQIAVNQDLNRFDQGRKFLNSLIFEKEVKITCKGTCLDGTILALAECGVLSIGEEMVKKGFAERSKCPVSNNNCDTQTDSSKSQSRNAKPTTSVWSNRANSAASNRVRGFGDHMPQNGWNENNTANHVPFIKEKMIACDLSRASNISLAKIKQEQKLIEENLKLKEEKMAFKEENQNLLHLCEELKSKVEKLDCELEAKEKAHKETLSTYVGTTVRNLAVKFEKLKDIRHTSLNDCFGEDLSEAVKAVTEECLAAPPSLEKLEKIWAEYNIAQEEISSCKYMDEVQNLIPTRNEMQQKLYCAVDEFIMEVDKLPISERLATLQRLQEYLEAAYGEAHEAQGSEGIFEEFFEWKHVKMEGLNHVRSTTDASLQDFVTCFNGIIKCFDITSETFLKSEDAIGNIDDVLKKAELDISQELNISLVELDEADKNIILTVYNEVMWKIHQEQCLLTAVYHKYLDSVEFKKQIVEWLDRSPNIDDLLLVKKRLKNLKAQLRWKLVEKSNLEECDDYNESEMAKIKEEIAVLRNSVFQNVSQEQEEYEKLNHLVQKWFPELPLLHPEAGILEYMNSGGLLTVNLERDLLDAEPMKELSTKHSVVRSEFQGQKVLLKGYVVDMNTETGVIKRAAEYHKAWRELKEESGLMQLVFLFLCRCDPLAYVMVPYYAGASLGALQASVPLTPGEILKIMKGVARGLQTLHTANVVHGSLHEKNVFAVNREQGIVGDFDFTKSVDQRVAVDYILANGLSLTSPEVKNGQPPSPASDMYAYGCLLYWLFVGNVEIKRNHDGTPQIDGINMDDKVRSLLLNLLCCGNRMISEQVLNDDCFLLPDLNPVPPEDEPAECGNEGEKTKSEIGSDDLQGSESEHSSETVILDTD
ncbi:serine/threonine-protein kinase 31 [Heteronotia binoei]|uniref:serine/threonine-protein kinase 31 n=1 Tax=Heteronotia binoei TaxID=13085 RepID=UPI00292DB8CD|nr:serine/threonine-protein kinase 31 [Heteronotia binoei]XP_060104632.1 serine/threonine-protein kinase 31 [Heteronotia binoei]